MKFGGCFGVDEVRDESGDLKGRVLDECESVEWGVKLFSRKRVGRDE